MSKSVLVIDTPKGCMSCPLAYKPEDEENIYCPKLGINIVIIEDEDEPGAIHTYKPDYCPLRPIPEMKEINPDPYHVSKTEKYNSGWNACINEITGGGENG